MFSPLATIVQFLGAIYVTIVFDNVLFRRFWSPDFYTLLDMQLKRYDLPRTTQISNWLESVKQQNRQFQENSRKRGTIFLYASFMILTGISIVGKDDDNLQWPILTLCCCTYLMWAFMTKVMNRWIWLLLGLVISTILFAVSFLYNPFDIQLTGRCDIVRLALIVVLLIPICYQILKSWLSSTALKCYYTQQLKIIHDEYNEAKYAITQQDSSKIPETYKQAFVNASFVQNNKEDVQLTNVNNRLKDQLSKLSKDISWSMLIKAYLSNPPENEEKKSYTLKDENDSISEYNKHYQLSTNISDIEHKSKLYDESTPRPKIKEFCKIHKIDEQTFRDYRKVHKRSRQR